MLLFSNFKQCYSDRTLLGMGEQQVGILLDFYGWSVSFFLLSPWSYQQQRLYQKPQWMNLLFLNRSFHHSLSHNQVSHFHIETTITGC